MTIAFNETTAYQSNKVKTAGFSHFWQLFPQFRKDTGGGSLLYPFATVLSGFEPSMAIMKSNPTAVPDTYSVNISAGKIELDGQKAELASSVDAMFTPVGVANGKNWFILYVNPTRKCQIVTKNSSGVYPAPTTRLNGDPVADGDQYLEACDLDYYYLGHTLFVRDLGVWKVVDPTFLPVPPGGQKGKARMMLNETHTKIADDNFTFNEAEASVFWSNRLAPNLPNMSGYAQMREPGSMIAAIVEVYFHVLPRPITATFTNGSTSVTVAVADRELVADIMASVMNTNTLRVDGAAIATTGYNDSTGVITLAAAYAGTTGAGKVVNITPATAGANFVVSPLRSKTYRREEQLKL